VEADQEASSEAQAWVREYLPLIHRYFRRRAPIDDCDDLTSEVFATAWRRRDDVPREAVLPWLYRTAGYVLANHRRVRTDLAVGDASEVAALSRVGGSPDDPAELAIEAAGLRTAWESLTERDREVLLLSSWEGLNGRELAEALGITVGGAGAALFRARAALAEAFEDRERSATGGTQG
jgi:RNA polymerase sigma factor (sigma-70 family)